MLYIIYFLITVALSLSVTPLIKRLAIKTGTLDFPKSERKIHKTPVPLLGGLAVYLAFAITIIGYVVLAHPDFAIIPKKFFAAIIIGGLLLMLGGALDDKFDLPPKILWLFPAISSA